MTNRVFLVLAFLIALMDSTSAVAGRSSRRSGGHSSYYVTEPVRPQEVVTKTVGVDGGYSLKGRWLKRNDERSYQYKDAAGNWHSAVTFQEVTDDNGGKFVNAKGEIVKYRKGDILFKDGIDWRKAPSTDVVEIDPDPADVIAKLATEERARLGKHKLVRVPRLDAAARDRARVISTYWGHFDQNGDGPPKYVRARGFPLPEWMANGSNQIESIANAPTAETTWNLWMNSSDHANHILGHSGFTAAHTHFGVGEYNGYYVFLSAPIAKP